jgi:hypothetical protein
VDSADDLGAGYPSEVDVANTPRSACWPHEKRKRPAKSEWLDDVADAYSSIKLA